MPSSDPLDPTNYTTLISGTSWHDGSGLLTYSLLSTIPSYYPQGATPGTYDVDGTELSTTLDVSLTALQQSLAIEAIAVMNEVANLNIVAAAPGSVGDITFGRADFNNPGLFGFAYYPNENVIGTPTQHGDVWLNTMQLQEDADRYNTGWNTFIHELGHALGLSHPFDSPPYLDASLDTNQYSVMSYDLHPSQTSVPYELSQWPATPMLYDIQALQSIYGANMSTRAGDNTYFGPGANQAFALANQGKLIVTIWDAGGIDTISAANQTVAASIDLRPGHFSTIGSIANNIAIALGITGTGAQSAWIENATGSSRNDTLQGNEIDNSLLGGAGIDTLFGDDGNDTLDGGSSGDTMSGGDGNDTYHVNATTDVVTELLNEGADTVLSIINYDLTDHVEALTLVEGSAAKIGRGNALGNQIIGNAQINTLYGGDGEDTLSGNGGNDTLYGEAGSDVLNGGLGNDRLDGGADADTLNGGGGNDTYVITDALDTIFEIVGEGTADLVESTIDITLLAANVENLTLKGTTGRTAHGNDQDNIITGTSYADTLFGGLGIDRINGANGNDTLHGEGGVDILDGGQGRDTLFGGDSSDQLIGGTGRDEMTGGTGNDRFVFNAGDFGGVTLATADLITDFTRAEADRIRLDSIDANSANGAATNEAFSFIGTTAFGGVAGQLRYEISGTNTIIMGDIDGNSAADFWIRLDDPIAMISTDFIL